MGSTGGATACVMSVLIGVAGGGTGRGTDSTVVGTKWLRVSRAAVSGSGLVILFRFGVMDGVITVGNSGGSGLFDVEAEAVSGHGVGVAHGPPVTS